MSSLVMTTSRDENCIRSGVTLNPPLPTPCTSNSLLQSAARELFSRALGDSDIVIPTEILTKGTKIDASSLKMGEGGHFYKCPSKDELINYHTLLGCYVRYYDSAKVAPVLLPHLLKCEFEIITRITRLEDKVCSEQELRYAIGDPILDMICNIGDFGVQLEERVESQYPSFSYQSQSNTPSHSVSSALSIASHPDYTVYTMRNKDKRVVAVIIEAKMTSDSSFEHVEAQAIGYFTATVTEVETQPVVFILTELGIKVLLFPFNHEGLPLINAVSLKYLPLWYAEREISRLNIDLLVMILMSILNVDKPFSIPYRSKCDANNAVKKRDVNDLIQTEKIKDKEALEKAQAEIENLKQQFKALQAARKKLKQQLKQQQHAVRRQCKQMLSSSSGYSRQHRQLKRQHQAACKQHRQMLSSSTGSSRQHRQLKRRQYAAQAEIEQLQWQQ